MGSIAIACAQEFFEGIVFARVSRTSASEPGDVLFVRHKACTGFDQDNVPIFVGSSLGGGARPSSIPEEERWCHDVAWRHYDGVTQDGITFSLADYHELDFGFGLDDTVSGTNKLSTGNTNRPADGDWIAGRVVDGRFKQWFILTSQLRFLIEMVRSGETVLNKAELAEQLLVDDNPDILWAFALLVMLDDVEPFIYFLGHKDEHPCLEKPYGQTFYNGTRRKVRWSGMNMTIDLTKYICFMSHKFQTPAWWSRYQAAFDWNPPLALCG